MSVTFKKNSFTIEVECYESPIENWLDTQNDLLDLLQAEDANFHAGRFHYIELLRSMQPDIDTAKKMLCTTTECATFAGSRFIKNACV